MYIQQKLLNFENNVFLTILYIWAKFENENVFIAYLSSTVSLTTSFTTSLSCFQHVTTF